MILKPEGQLELLRRFEPVMHFTRGEIFFPMDVEPYVRACSLWKQRPDEDAICLVPQDELILGNLAQARVDEFDTLYFLRFIEPFDILKLIAFLRKRRKTARARGEFRFGYGRLARVGYSSRFVDLLFSLSLLLRGRVPGDASASAALEYENILAEGERYCYHGRVVRQGDWIVLQYWFFYAFNNWRSGFFGLNDHEADWELVNVYLYESDQGELTPEWVAYSSHDFSGDDLRRRWDDPELEKVGDHPRVYAGAGSHACYFAPGEYQAEIGIPIISPLARFTRWVLAGWRRITRGSKKASPSPGDRSAMDIFRVPFVDYARGDGLSIGSGSERRWEPPRLLDPPPDWVTDYQGLWGLFTQDPVSGENAPAGPMFNQDGTVRRAWCDPLGWVGLDKVPPPNQVLARLRQKQAELRERREELNAEIARLDEQLTGLGVANAAIRGRSHLEDLDLEQREQIATLSDGLAGLRAQRAADDELLLALRSYERGLLQGQRDPPRAHIQRAARPASESDLRYSRVVELWAAASVGLMMIGFVGLILFFRHHIILGLVAMISIFVFIESGFRRQLPRLINSVAIGLAIVCSLIILFEFFWTIVVLAVLAAGVFILWENLREFRRW